MKHLALSTLPLFISLSVASPAMAYRYRTCTHKDTTKIIKWRNGSSKTVQAGSGSYASGSSRRDSLNAAIKRWNQSPMNYRINISWGHSISSGNDESEVWYSSDDDFTDDRPAFALVWYRCEKPLFKSLRADIRTVDVVMNNDVDWTNYTTRTKMTSHGGDFRPARTTLIHEFGHFLGLKHSNSRYNIMGSDTTFLTANDNSVRAYVGEDASSGMVKMYGLNSGRSRDVSVTHRKYGGKSSDPEYSKHSWVQVLNESGSQVKENYWSNSNQARIYKVKRGQKIKAEFTFENNGSRFEENPKVNFYISSNNNITLSDTKIASSTYTLKRNKPYEAKKNLTIPNWVVKDKVYFLGAYVDPDNVIPEVSGANNKTYIGIKVVD